MHLLALKGPGAGTVFPLQPGENTAGRGQGNHIFLQSAHVSTRHCVFIAEPGRVVLRDLGSTNGVYVEGQRVNEAALQHGSHVQIGDWIFALDMAEAAAPPAPQASAWAPQAFPAQPAANPAPAGFGAYGQSLGGFGEPAAAAWPKPAEPQGTTFAPEPAPQPQPTPQAAPLSSGFGAPATGFGAPSGPVGGTSGFGRRPDDNAGLGFGEIAPMRGEESLSVGESEDWLARGRRIWKRLRSFPWNLQLAALLVALLLFVTLVPFGGLLGQVLHTRFTVQDQVLETGKALAYALAQRNVGAIAENNNLKLEADFIRGEKGIRQSMITDNMGTVRAPPESVGRSIAKQDFFGEANTIGTTTVARKGGGEYHILAPIRVRVVEGGPINTAGWAYIVYDAGEIAAERAPWVPRLVGGLVVLLLGLGVTGLAMWRLANSPVSNLREELELVMRGHVAQVAVPSEWKNLRELSHSINRLVSRWKKGDAGTASKLRDKASAMIEGLPVPVFLTDGELRVIHTSDAALQWLNTPREALLGRPIGEILPDRALVDALLAACGRVTRKEANIVADTSRLGGNRVRLVVTDAETEGVLTLVSVG